MAYNPSQRRGLYSKKQGRKKPRSVNKKPVESIEHNGCYAYLQQFLEWSQVKGFSQTTISTRKRGLVRFIRWCDERALDRPQDITLPILERYQHHLYYTRKANGEPLSLGTQYTLLTPLKAWFKWLARERHLFYNPASELDIPPQPRGIPKNILSAEEVERVMALTDIGSPYGIRDRAILETLYSTGVRRMELVNLQLHDIDAARQTLLVRQGKGGKDRLLPLGERALYWIEKYKRDVRPQLLSLQDTGHLFLTDYGEPWIKGRLAEMVKKYLYHARIDKPGACHLFRHAMATHMLDNGADIRFIQAMLGHANLSTTEIYTQVSIEKLRAVHRATHPARLKPKANNSQSLNATISEGPHARKQ